MGTPLVCCVIVVIGAGEIGQVEALSVEHREKQKQSFSATPESRGARNLETIDTPHIYQTSIPNCCLCVPTDISWDYILQLSFHAALAPNHGTDLTFSQFFWLCLGFRVILYAVCFTAMSYYCTLRI